MEIEIDNGYEDGISDSSDASYGGDNGLNNGFEQRLEDIVSSVDKEDGEFLSWGDSNTRQYSRDAHGGFGCFGGGGDEVSKRGY